MGTFGSFKIVRTLASYIIIHHLQQRIKRLGSHLPGSGLGKLTRLLLVKCYFITSPSLLLKLRNVVATQSAEIWDTTFDFTGFYFLAEIILMTWPAPPTLHYISLISVFPCMMLNIKCLDAVYVFICNCVLCIPPWPTLACSFAPHPHSPPSC